MFPNSFLVLQVLKNEPQPLRAQTRDNFMSNSIDTFIERSGFNKPWRLFDDHRAIEATPTNFHDGSSV